MAKTYRFDSKESKMLRDGEKTSEYLSQESKYVRKRNIRDIRRETKHKLREANYDLLPIYPHTCGWETH